MKEEMHIVKSVILEKEYDFNKKNNNKIRVFAVNVNSAEEMAMIATKLITPINPNGFMTYVGKNGRDNDIRNAEEAIIRGEKTMVFHEDIALSYPEKLKNVIQKYTNIKVFEVNQIKYE